MSSFDGTLGDHISVPARPPANGTVSLSAASAVDTAGTAVDFVDPDHHVVMLVSSTPGTTGGVVSLQISDKGTEWYETGIETFPLTADGNVAIVSSTFARFARAYISTGIVGGTVTAVLVGVKAS